MLSTWRFHDLSSHSFKTQRNKKAPRIFERALLKPKPSDLIFAVFRAARPPLTSGWERSWPEMVRSWQRGQVPIIFVFFFALSFLFSFGPPIGSYRPAAITTPLLSFLPLYLLSIRSGFVDTSVPLQWASRSSTAVDVWWASGVGTSSSPSFYHPYLWGWFFKTLFEEPLPHPNRMVSFAMSNSIRLSGFLGWDYGSKSTAASDIDSRGCSCAFMDGGQIMCRSMLFLLFCLYLLLL